MTDIPSTQNRPGSQEPVIPRVGTGVDVHAFGEENTELWIAGLYWPDERGLSGHSDGDVVAHAAADALFAASGTGDLGSNFGVDRPDMAGASGVRSLGGGGNRASGRFRDRQHQRAADR